MQWSKLRLTRKRGTLPVFLLAQWHLKRLCSPALMAREYPLVAEWWENRDWLKTSVLEVVTHQVEAFTTPEKRLEYLNALENRVKILGYEDWVQAIAKDRLNQQLKD